MRVGAAVDHVRAESLEQRLEPLPRHHGDDPGVRRRQAAFAGGDLLAHVGDVEPLHVSGVLEHGDGHLGLVGVDVDLQRGRVADDQHRVADLLEPPDEGARVESLPGDDEVGAIAESAVEVMGTRLPGRLVMGDVGDRVELPAQPGDDPRQDHDQPVRSGVDDARLGEHVELLGGSLDRVLPRLGGHREHLGQQLVLLGVAGLRGQPLAVHVREVLRDRVRHLADHGQHRSLGGVTHRFVGRVGGARERRRDQHRVDQLPRAARQLLGGAADDLAQDDAGVAARAHQRRAGDGVDDRLAGLGVDRLPVEAVQLAHHGAHGQRHVVPGVPVGDREHVQVVDLLAALLQVPVGGLDDPAEALDGGVGHRRWGLSRRACPARQAALVTLFDFRQRVQT